MFDPRPDPDRTPHRLRVRRRSLGWRSSTGATHRVGLRGRARPGDFHVGQRRTSSPPRRSTAPRGYWWSPGRSVAPAVCRVDTSPVQRWYLGDPAHPEQAPRELPYPAAGTSNAVVSLHLISLDGALDGGAVGRRRVPLPRRCLVGDRGVIARDRAVRAIRSPCGCSLSAPDAESGLTVTVFADDDEAWVDLVSGVPRAACRRTARDVRGP